jgi:hypothetical protein
MACFSPTDGSKQQPRWVPSSRCRLVISTTVLELQQGRFTVVTRDGVRWDFVVREHGHSGYGRHNVALHYDGDATPFVLALQNLTRVDRSKLPPTAGSVAYLPTDVPWNHQSLALLSLTPSA